MNSRGDRPILVRRATDGEHTAAGATVIPVPGSAGLVIGDLLRVDPGGPTEEDAQVVDLFPLTVDRPLAFAHPQFTPVRKLGPPSPDATINGKGDDLYGSSGKGETKNADLAPGTAKTFRVEIQNEEHAAGDFKIAGSDSTDPFVVRYLEGTTDITAAVKAGAYVIQQLPAGESRTIRMKVKVKRTAVPGTIGRFRVKTKTGTTTVVQDVVRATVQVIP